MRKGQSCASKSIGRRFGKLIIIEVCGKLQGSNLYLCKCDCGEFFKSTVSRLRLKIHKHCNKCSKKSGKGYYKLEEGEGSFNRLFKSYKNNSKNNNRIFLLNKEEFKILTKQNCYYCGIEPYKEYNSGSNGNYIYNGIDRINNNKGYIKDNIRTCCFICNQAKHTLNETDFMNWIKRICNYNKL